MHLCVAGKAAGSADMVRLQLGQGGTSAGHVKVVVVGEVLLCIPFEVGYKTDVAAEGVWEVRVIAVYGSSSGVWAEGDMMGLVVAVVTDAVTFIKVVTGHRGFVADGHAELWVAHCVLGVECVVVARVMVTIVPAEEALVAGADNGSGHQDSFVELAL